MKKEAARMNLWLHYVRIAWAPVEFLPGVGKLEGLGDKSPPAGFSGGASVQVWGKASRILTTFISY